MLSEENYRKIVEVVDYFGKKQDIALDEENAATFITHLCGALERIDRGEKINMIDDEVYNSAKEEATFERALRIGNELSELLECIPEEELKFIVTHVGVLLSRIP
jgi:transcriptional antiterminator